MKRILLISILIISVGFIKLSFAIDYPHNGDSDMDCPDCHTMHGAPGSSGLISFDTIANLCEDCHSSVGIAASKPFESVHIAKPGDTGITHNWEVSMKADTPPLNLKAAAAGGRNNIYGLRLPGELTNSNLRMMLNQFDETLTCVTCHQQHSQRFNTWDPDMEDTEGLATAGSLITIVDSTKEWTSGEWVDVYVTMNNRTKFGRNASLRTRKIVGNDETSLTLESDLLASVASDDEYFIHARHFQRIPTELTADPNNVNDMCEDCHYYRTPPATGGEMDVTTWDGNKKSHPIVADLTTDVKDPTQFVGAAPLETINTPQTGAPRYHGDADGNPTNNKVLDSSSRVRCLTCHGIHYTDSDESTIDGP